MRPRALLVPVLAALCAAAVFPLRAEDTVHVALIGDSVFEETYLPAEARLDAVLLARLKEAYPNQNVAVHNVSKSGATIPKYTATGGAYETKLKGALKELDLCFVAFGINDEDRFTPEEFRKNLEGLCDRVLADYPGAKLVLCTSIACKSRAWWKEMGAEAEEPISKKHYAQTRELAKARGFPLTDLYAVTAALLKKDEWDLRIRNQKLSMQHYKQLILDGSKDAERQADGDAWFKDVHPNAACVEKLADAMRQTLKEAHAEALPNEGQPKP
ncbi:MAG: SGNH/GDSL hydrolase family protein [Planctomycetota bacterium]|nr:SGNH/GDSL hydrolase family protein [Planctomycetota bacterium]